MEEEAGTSLLKCGDVGAEGAVEGDGAVWRKRDPA